MQPTPLSAECSHLLATPQPKMTAHNTCPICGGGLIETRSLQRCVRCGFALCQGCEGGLAQDGDDETY